MIPKIVIVGRPNVGKSSLFNMLAGRRVSIVDPTAGVTRDRVSAIMQFPPTDATGETRSVELIDTGGYGIVDNQNLTAQIEQQIAYAIADAQLILFVTDAQTGIVPLDQEIAQLLRTSDSQTPIIVVANKVDSPHHEATAHEGFQLGYGPPLGVSSVTGFNKTALVEAIGQCPSVNHASTPKDSSALFAIAGKRNAGKSTLVNTLAGEPRVIVSEIEGTTRDSIDVRFELDGKTFTAIDTAGVRKTKSLSGDIEYYSLHRTLRSIRRADVVLLLIDAAVPISQVDKQLANEILKHHKPCVIVLNKWDLAQENYTQDEYLTYLDGAMKGLKFAPVAFISAKNNDGARETIDTAISLHRQADKRVPTSRLNQIMEKILLENTPTSKIGRRPKIYYVTQLDTHPPTIGLFVNDPSQFDPGYQRFLINRFRELLPFPEIPIKLLIRGKRNLPGHAKPTPRFAAAPHASL